jgi:Flp pilus assembly protein CpaB
MAALNRELWKKAARELGRRYGGASITVAALAGLVVCFEARCLLQPRPHRIEDPRFLLARRPLPSGKPIHFLDFTASFEAPGGVAPKAALTDQDLPLLSGARLLRPLGEGEVLTLDALQLPSAPGPLGPTIPKGMRAYAIQVAGGLEVRAGERVDVVLGEGENPDEVPLTLLEAALVLAVREQEGTGRELVLAVAAEDIPPLEKASQKGKLNIALRNPGEASPSRPPRARRSPGRAPRSRPKIEIFSEES